MAPSTGVKSRLISRERKRNGIPIGRADSKAISRSTRSGNRQMSSDEPRTVSLESRMKNRQDRGTRLCLIPEYLTYRYVVLVGEARSVLTMQYHQEIEYTGQGLKRGPVLKVTPDGESEHPPGQTPVPSRQGSSADTRLQRASDREEDYERAMGHDRSDGTWRTAMENGHASPGQHQKERKKGSSGSRFGSFRARPPSEQHDSHDSDGDEHDKAHEAAQRRWQMLRSRVIPSRQATTGGPTPGAAKVSALSSTAVGSVPVTTELLAGQLPVMILKTWLDRDEEGNRAVPVLLGNLRFRVGDSVGLRQGSPTGKEMFKLECEYGDGAVKWVSPPGSARLPS